MEIIIGIIVIAAIGVLVFGRKSKAEEVVAEPVPTVTEVVEPTPAPVVEPTPATAQGYQASVEPAKKARKPKAAPAEKAAKPKKAAAAKAAAKAPAKKPAAKAKSKKA